jgi:uncharacterized protein YktB (UPF0637 family)
MNINPKLKHIGAGFLAGLTIGLGNAYYANRTVEEYQSIAESEKARYEKAVSDKSIQIARLSTELSQLKSSVKRTVVKNADGSSSETFEKLVDKSTDSRLMDNSSEHVRAEQTTVDNEKTKTDIKKTIEHKKLSLLVGYDITRSDYVIGGAYPILGPWGVFGTMSTNGLSSGFVLGVSLSW